MVTYQTCTRGSINVPESLRQHDHEVANTLILRHASIVDKTALVDISATDMVIVLQLVQWFLDFHEDNYFHWLIFHLFTYVHLKSS